MVRMYGVPVLLSMGLALLVVSAAPWNRSVARAQAPAQAADSAGAQRMGFAGDAACLPCHQEQSLAYRRTSHHLASQPAGGLSILGSFADGSNILTISEPGKSNLDPHLYFRMEAKDGGFYQTAVAEQGSERLVHSEPIDLVIGSGVRGQTYLFWAGRQLYELPVSFWSDGQQWINSPGYRDGTANFGRKVNPRCLECHATYIKALSPDPQTNLYDRPSLVPGISCESCHGAGADHVAKKSGGHRSGAEAISRNTIVKHTILKDTILNPARFERDRQIDQCALCHNGTQREELAPAFSYLPGQPLDKYLAPNLLDADDHPDVHGNQVGLLKRSRCYLSSPAMSCSTCHNVHRPERSAAEYSERCLDCHRWQSCGAAKMLGEKIVRNCIDCHMPLEQTSAIVSETAGRVVRTSIRSHWIKVYPGKELPGGH